MKRSVGFILIGITLVGFVEAAVAQGLYWESTMNGGESNATRTKTFYMPRMFKMIQDADGARCILFRLDREKMYMLHTGDKTYSEITFAEIEKQMDGVKALLDQKMAEVKKQLESLPADQRKAIEEQMGTFVPSEETGEPAEVVNTGERRVISGFSTTRYLVRKGGKETMSLWVTGDVKNWRGMRADFAQFSKRMTSLSRITRGISEAYQNIEGFPVQTEMGGMTNTVTKAEQRFIPASEFEVPAGYKKIEGTPFGESGND